MQNGDQPASPEQHLYAETLAKAADDLTKLVFEANMEQLRRSIEKEHDLWRIGMRTNEQFKAKLDAFADQYAEAGSD